MAKKGKKSITKRWLFNTLGIFVIVLLVVDIAVTYAVKNYYYSSAKQYLISKMNILSSVVQQYSLDNNKNFSTQIRSFVEDFDDKSRIELMAVDTNGDIAVTSSGYMMNGKITMNDYEEAKVSNSQSGFDIYELDTGEKVMSYCVMLPASSTSKYSAVRMMTSIHNVDNQIVSIAIVLTLLAIAIIIFIALSGLYFIKSIVIPVRQIGQTARQFATGDFSVRIKKRKNDEIGELCDIINSMADELSNTENVKNEFISSVSHELRTPLTAIKGWSETLNTYYDPETLKKGMKVITSETERLSDMVEELLDFSRMQNGKFTLEKTTIDILAELEEAVLVYQQKVKNENKTITYNEPNMLPFVYGDRNRLRQVFINIIDNAIKYSEAGTNVEVLAYEDEENVVIKVKDHGCGISQEDLSKVKVKFYKANHTKRGSGIGLAVADEIVTMHNGTLDISSEEGVGTVVTITLPAFKKKTHTKIEVDVNEQNSAERKNLNE